MTIDASFDLDDFVRRVLAEDLGEGRDVTSASTIPADAEFTASINCRETIVVAGIRVAAAFFEHLDPQVNIDFAASDGDRVDAGAVLMRLAGNARAMLAVNSAFAGIVAPDVTSPPSPKSSASTRRTKSSRSKLGSIAMRGL